MTASYVTVDVFFGTARGRPGRALLWQSVRQHLGLTSARHFTILITVA